MSTISERNRVNPRQTSHINLGILASIAWNSNGWTGDPTHEDAERTNFGSFKSSGFMHESLNFGHTQFPVEKDGTYIGYTSAFNKAPKPDKAKDVKIVFFISNDYQNQNPRTIVGLYGFPVFGDWFERKSSHRFYTKYNKGNIRALPENIIYFKTPLVTSDADATERGLVPKGKKISRQRFTYLNANNVNNLLFYSLELNSDNQPLKSFIERFFPLIDNEEEERFEDLYKIIGNINANTPEDVKKLEDTMKGIPPMVKERISKFIERGTIAHKIKEHTGYKCMICEAQKLPALGFKKRNGISYIEAHHVEPVSTGKTGVLSINNIITVCANHHRQLHYGNSRVEETTSDYFKFRIDDQTFIVNKIKLSD